MITRRNFIKGSIAAAAIVYIPNVAFSEYKSLREQVKENLSKLETITNKQAAQDYQDPNNANNELYVISDPDFSLTKNFKLKEFATSGGKIFPYARIDEDLVTNLQLLRDHLQQPITISSSYRTVSRNKAVGGSEKSRHLSGDAADIYAKGTTPTSLMKTIEDLFGENIGLHAYKSTGHVHLDFRGYKARW